MPISIVGQNNIGVRERLTWQRGEKWPLLPRIEHMEVRGDELYWLADHFILPCTTKFGQLILVPPWTELVNANMQLWCGIKEVW